jgi:hypothetical protein
MDALDTTAVNGTNGQAQVSDHQDSNGAHAEAATVAKMYATRSEAEATIPAGSSKHLKGKRPVQGRLAGSGMLEAFSPAREFPTMPKTQRDNSSREQFWRDTIRAWKASGQPVRAFCAAQGLSEPTFYARRRELADRAPPTTSDTPSFPPTTFAAVRIVPDPSVEVVLPAGLILRFPAGVHPAAVARLVAALGGQSC